MPSIISNYKIKKICPICGKIDPCMTMETDNPGEYIYYCSRIDQDSVIGTDGQEYIHVRTSTKRFTYYIYEERNQRERNYDNFLREHGYGKYRGRKKSRTTTPRPIEKKKKEVNEIINIAHPNFLDRVYRTFLSLLILEPFHKEELQKEWDCGVDKQLSKKLLSKWPIRSLPPNDRVRFTVNWIQYQNRLRKSIMKDLIAKVGDPKGVPGFYEKEDGSWTFINQSGIIFPVNNTYGQIIRLRTKDDFPEIKGSFNGTNGKFFFSFYGESVGWYFKEAYVDDEGTVQYYEPIIVYSNQIKKIDLINRKPEGEIKGKYKHFSCVEIRVETEDTIYTRCKYKNGVPASAAISIYVKKGDNLKYVYITEGEKKAMVLNMLLNVPVISLPGVGTYNLLFQNEEGYEETVLQRLKKFGLENAILVYDADKREKAQVATHEANALMALYQEVKYLFKGEWSAHFGKGADDAAIQGVRPKLFGIQY